MQKASGAIVDRDEAERACAVVLDAYTNGIIDESQLKQEYESLVWFDATGTRWVLGQTSRTWFHWDGDRWINASPLTALHVLDPSPAVSDEPEPPLATGDKSSAESHAIVPAAPARTRRNFTLTPLLLFVIAAAIGGAALMVRSMFPNPASAARQNVSAFTSHPAKAHAHGRPTAELDSPPPPPPNDSGTPFEVAGNYNVRIRGRRGKDCASTIVDFDRFVIAHSSGGILISFAQYDLDGTLGGDRAFDASGEAQSKTLSMSGTLTQGDSGVVIDDGTLQAKSPKGSCTIKFTAAKQ